MVGYKIHLKEPLTITQRCCVTSLCIFCNKEVFGTARKLLLYYFNIGKPQIYKVEGITKSGAAMMFLAKEADQFPDNIAFHFRYKDPQKPKNDYNWTFADDKLEVVRIQNRVAKIKVLNHVL